MKNFGLYYTLFAWVLTCVIVAGMAALSIIVYPTVDIVGKVAIVAGMVAIVAGCAAALKNMKVDDIDWRMDF